ncbi:hypothetical protein [Pseudonocardia sp.]|uniref:hypothetical protein n=1 Tax=Pseudonocardia sp. TaxID=60912 RepID=UPI003D0A697D
MALLLSSIAVGLVVWTALAVGTAVVLGRMCAHRDRQVCSRDLPAHLHPEVPYRTAYVRSSVDAVERSGS